ncbi:hypothetical protein INP57_26630 [Saccharopolyspora sp. HNM0986]|uniref:hypothetical protein n=1 Tax=Saccharopolyspora galaxeae TaxID=2781241 RepID=UPI00190C83A4|nr:hypothetical protein [Saccharopolyspora sp. HNM0986]MBK0870389.1 hypothetical protein [Saccharopolyspora sp. HNM0986]
MLALVLAVVSGGCLAAGWLLEQIVLVYVALALSAAGLVLVVASVWRRRQLRGQEAAGDGESADNGELPDSAEDVEASGDAAAARSGAAAGPDSAAEPSREIFVALSTGQRLDDDAMVGVVPGRKRFHSGECRLVRGKQVQWLTLVEAREEEFTACSVCVEIGAGALLSEQR